jgi:hypothetical protein
MRSGVRRNPVDDLEEDELWNDFAVIGQQMGLFTAVVLIQQVPHDVGLPAEKRNNTFDPASVTTWFSPLQNGQVFRAALPTRR